MKSLTFTVAITTTGLALGLASSSCEQRAQRDTSAQQNSPPAPPANAQQHGSPLTTSARRATGARAPTEAKDAKGFVQNIDALTTGNQDFRRVLYTAKNVQLVVMALAPGDHIGLEVHDGDQFFRVEAGKGEVVIGQVHTPIGDGTAIIVPAGAIHDIINTGNEPLKLYTLYAPPHHRDGVVQRTHADADKDTEAFDGKTTE